MNNLTEIKLHGILGEQMGRDVWNLAVNSVSEAVRAIEILSKRKLYKYLIQNDEKSIKYRVLINGRDFESKKQLDNLDDLEALKSSELVINFKNLKTIDVVPVLEGADGNGTVAIIIGALLVVAGVILLFVGAPIIGAALIMAGIGLIAAGVINLLTNPPKIDDFQKIQDGGRPSYLFSGPQNTTREGGPVPVGYGRMLVGSQVLSASYEISHVNADNNPLTA